jgi:hypothetical protein
MHSQDRWRDSELKHPFARISIEGVRGLTVSEPVGAAHRGRYGAVVYASTDAGVLEHEVVHAYCVQAFGATGPDWYKEGMADAVAFRGDGASGVQCPGERLDELRGASRKSIRQIVGSDRLASDLSKSMGVKLAALTDPKGQVSLSQWTERDAQDAHQARRDYLWAWALCHLLIHNPNYASRFHLLGESYLSKRDDSFERVFAPMTQELDFEYRFFLDRMDVGYRVDLCGWDWGKRFRTLSTGDAIGPRVLARRGYQASGLTVSAGRRYGYAAEGAWSTTGEGELFSADGAGEHGQLEGVVLTDFHLSEPFALGAEGTFVAPATGNLYLRCRDVWSQLADNRGEVQVRLTER